MTEKIDATVNIVWDDAGGVSAHVDAAEAADQLEQISSGRFRRVLTLHLSLPSTTPLEMSLDVTDDRPAPTARKA